MMQIKLMAAGATRQSLAGTRKRFIQFLEEHLFLARAHDVTLDTRVNLEKAVIFGIV